MTATLTLNVGDTGSIEAHSPRPGTITYSSSDPGVVTVDENGRLPAVGAGTAVITVTLPDSRLRVFIPAEKNRPRDDNQPEPGFDVTAYSAISLANSVHTPSNST